MTNSDTAIEKPSLGFFSRRIVAPVRKQICQGVSPKAISLAIALGSSTGVFPILGLSTVLGATIGFLTKLNQPILHTFSWLVYPIQILTIPFFVRMGESVFRAQPVPFSVPQLIERFQTDPTQFFKNFGMSGVHGIVAWLIVAPFLTLAILMIAWPLLEAATRRWRA